MQERRASPRSAVRIKVRVVICDGVFDATMVNVSQGGVRLIVDKRRCLPSRLYLWITKVVTLFQCEVRWQRENAVGLQFIDVSGQSLQRAMLSACISEPVDRITPITRHSLLVRSARRGHDAVS
jgi:hypothetical protein